MDRPFDLAAGGLLRVLLVRVAPDEHVLLMAAHHAITDGWSGEILLGELLTLHAGGTLDPLPIQYGDYALWERTRDHAADLAYWRARLAGVPPLELPLDLPRPAEQTTTGRGHRFRVDPDLLTRFADQGVTPYMVDAGRPPDHPRQVVGQRDFAVGSPVSGRPLPRARERWPGCSSTRSRCGPTCRAILTFGDFLIRVRDSCLDAYAHQELPFDKLVGELKVERDVSRSAVFQVMLAHQGYEPPADHGLKVSAFHPEVTVSRFDLAFYLWEDDGLVIYNPDLFRPETVGAADGVADGRPGHRARDPAVGGGLGPGRRRGAGPRRRGPGPAAARPAAARAPAGHRRPGGGVRGRCADVPGTGRRGPTAWRTGSVPGRRPR